MLSIRRVGAGRAGLADGVVGRPDASKPGDSLRSTGVAKYSEPMLRGQLFCGTTALGVDPASFYSLYNPFGSDVIVYLVDYESDYVSGTFNQGFDVFTASFRTAPATELTGAIFQTITPCLIGGPPGKCVFILQGAVFSSPSWNRVNFYSGLYTSEPTVYFGEGHKDFRGQMAVLPGQILLILQSALVAGAAPLGVRSLVWAEIPFD